jgi:hypothetical protein
MMSAPLEMDGQAGLEPGWNGMQIDLTLPGIHRTVWRMPVQRMEIGWNANSHRDLIQSIS